MFKTTWYKYIRSAEGGTIGEFSDYKLKLAAGFTIILTIIAFFIQTTYREFIKSYISLMKTDEYSHLITSLFTTLVVIYISFKYLGFSYEVRVSKALASLLFFTFSVFFLVLSRIDLYYLTQLMGLSLVFLTLSLIVTIHNPIFPRDVIPLFSLFLLVPLPPSIVDSLTPWLSRYIGKTAAFLTGATLVESPLYSQIQVNASRGSGVFSVEAAYSGVVTISSIIAITPILLCIAAYSVSSLKKKVLAMLLSISTAICIGLLGDLIRVILVIIGTMKYGVEVGLQFLHYSPPIVYSSLSALASFMIAYRVAGFRHLMPRRITQEMHIEWRFIAGVMTLLLLLSTAYHGVLEALLNINKASDSIVIESLSIDDFINSPSKSLFNNVHVTVEVERYSEFLTRVLGAISVFEIAVSINRTNYRGYIEIVDTPSKLHTWQLCLSLQGYYVTNSWSELANSTFTHYMSIEKGGERSIMAYKLIPIAIRTPTGDYKLYTRLSLISSADDLSEALSNLRKALLSSLREGGMQKDYIGMLSNISTIFYGLIALNIAYALSLIFIKVLNKRGAINPRSWRRKLSGV